MPCLASRSGVSTHSPRGFKCPLAGARAPASGLECPGAGWGSASGIPSRRERPGLGSRGPSAAHAASLRGPDSEWTRKHLTDSAAGSHELFGCYVPSLWSSATLFRSRLHHPLPPGTCPLLCLLPPGASGTCGKSPSCSEHGVDPEIPRTSKHPIWQEAPMGCEARRRSCLVCCVCPTS